MGEAEQRILQMLEDGLITSGEANKLLLALRPENALEPMAAEVTPVPQKAAREQIGPPPAFDRVRQFWLIPPFVAAGSLIVSGLVLYLMYRSVENVAALGFLCVWSFFVLALAATGILVLARRATWLYLRVEEKGVTRFSLGIPLPLRFVGWAMALARPFVPREQLIHLETAAAFVEVMRHDPNKEPIIIDVDDDGGDKVQIYIG